MIELHNNGYVKRTPIKTIVRSFEESTHQSREQLPTIEAAEPEDEAVVRYKQAEEIMKKIEWK